MNNLTLKQPQPKTGKPKKGDPEPEDPLILRAPTVEDGARIHQLISDCPPLDVNSVYAYLLLAGHFADTCVVAEHQERLVGFISAYIPPNQPDVLFIWQVAVHSAARGQGLGQRMLHHLLERTGSEGIRYMETTVSPDNQASRSMFQGVARQLNTQLNENVFLEAHHFGEHAHADEPLLRIGPLPHGQ